MKDTEKGAAQEVLVSRAGREAAHYALGLSLEEMELDKPAFPLCKERAFQVNFHSSISLDQ